MTYRVGSWFVFHHGYHETGKPETYGNIREFRNSQGNRENDRDL